MWDLIHRWWLFLVGPELPSLESRINQVAQELGVQKILVKEIWEGMKMVDNPLFDSRLEALEDLCLKMDGRIHKLIQWRHDRDDERGDIRWYSQVLSDLKDEVRRLGEVVHGEELEGDPGMPGLVEDLGELEGELRGLREDFEEEKRVKDGEMGYWSGEVVKNGDKLRELEAELSERLGAVGLELDLLESRLGALEGVSPRPLKISTPPPSGNAPTVAPESPPSPPVVLWGDGTLTHEVYEDCGRLYWRERIEALEASEYQVEGILLHPKMITFILLGTSRRSYDLEEDYCKVWFTVKPHLDRWRVLVKEFSAEGFPGVEKKAPESEVVETLCFGDGYSISYIPSRNEWRTSKGSRFDEIDFESGELRFRRHNVLMAFSELPKEGFYLENVKAFFQKVASGAWSPGGWARFCNFVDEVLRDSQAPIEGGLSSQDLKELGEEIEKKKDKEEQAVFSYSFLRSSAEYHLGEEYHLELSKGSAEVHWDGGYGDITVLTLRRSFFKSEGPWEVSFGIVVRSNIGVDGAFVPGASVAFEINVTEGVAEEIYRRCKILIERKVPGILFSLPPEDSFYGSKTASSSPPIQDVAGGLKARPTLRDLLDSPPKILESINLLFRGDFFLEFWDDGVAVISKEKWEDCKGERKIVEVGEMEFETSNDSFQVRFSPFTNPVLGTGDYVDFGEEEREQFRRVLNTAVSWKFKVVGGWRVGYQGKGGCDGNV